MSGQRPSASAPYFWGCFLGLLPLLAWPCWASNFCCGFGAWPGIFVAIQLEARRAADLRAWDGARLGFMIGGLVSVLRFFLAQALELLSFKTFPREEFLDSYQELFPTSEGEREALEETLAFLQQYGDALAGFSFALFGSLFGLVLAALLRERKRRRPPLP